MIRPIYICYESFHYIILLMADFEFFSELCAYQSLKKMRGNNEKRGRVTQVDRAATWHRTEEEKLLMMIKIFCVKIQRWQSDLVSLRSSKHQSEAGQIKDPTMRSSLMIEPKHLIFSHTKIPSLKILECGVKELPQTSVHWKDCTHKEIWTIIYLS